jgi:dipeptidyl aminopeptidase/acylaminoacyl peptidase
MKNFIIFAEINSTEYKKTMILRKFIISTTCLLIMTAMLSCKVTKGFETGLKIEYLNHPHDAKKKMEFYWMKPDGNGPWPAIVYIHGHQEGIRNGGKDFVTWGVLTETVKRGFVAVAISQPGYGNSDGPADFCGPFTQDAVAEVIRWMRQKPFIKADKIGVLGISRGAVVASMVATRDQQLAALVLISGLYDFSKRFNDFPNTDIKEYFAVETDGSLKALKDRSALYCADKIKTPTLIMNGAKDDRTDPEQARKLSEMIEKNGTFSKVIIYPEYGHQIPYAVRNQEINPFLDKYLLH